MAFGGQTGGSGNLGGGTKPGDYGSTGGGSSGGFQLPEDQTGPGPSAGTKAYIGEVNGTQVFYWKYDDNPSLYSARNAEAEAKAAAILEASRTKGVDVSWAVFHLSMEDVRTQINSGTERVDAEVTVLPDTGVQPGEPIDWGDWPLKLLIIGGIIAVAVYYLFLRQRAAPALPSLPAAPAPAVGPEVKV